MAKKIDIYYKGIYICTTIGSKTCKEAKEKFLKHPYICFFDFEVCYKKEYFEDLNNNSIDPTKVTASFQK
jgi:hypothetical protein